MSKTALLVIELIRSLPEADQQAIRDALATPVAIAAARPETAKEFFLRLYKPTTEKQFQHSVKFHLGGLRKRATEHGDAVVPRTSALSQEILSGLRESGFQYVRLNRSSKKRGVWTLEIQIGPIFVNPVSSQIKINIQRALRELGYAASNNDVYAVMQNARRIRAGFVLVRL